MRGSVSLPCWRWIDARTGLRPQLASGELKPILERWWPRFSGPYLYYPSRRHMPPPLRAFVDFVQRGGAPGQGAARR